VFVDDEFELPDPRAAQRFLRQFTPEMKRLGEGLFRTGKVQDLALKDNSRLYCATVIDEKECRVELDYDEELGWEGECSCDEGFDCAHLFAAMSAWLAEHRTATVRRLSSTLSNTSTGAALPHKVEAESPEAVDLTRRLSAATGKPLTREQTNFVRKVREVYGRCAQTRQITYWDFQQMGIQLTGSAWGGLHIWPNFPANEFEFWLYVANTAQEAGLPLPEFMAPVTDLAPIQARLAKWRRSREIDHWKQMLGNLQLQSPSELPPELGYTDLRVVIEEKAMELQWRRPGQSEFEAVKQTHLHGLASGRYPEGAGFTSEATLIWQLFSRVAYYGAKVNYQTHNMEMAGILSQLLRIPILESRIVQLDGQPLARPAEPLRWELLPAANENEDYRLRLVQPDGTVPPPIIYVCHGRPTFYLTLKAVFQGPSAPRHILEPGQETRIPAPALERAAGVAFLNSLGIAPPERVRERLRQLPYQVVIQAQLVRPKFGGGSEDCELTITAEAPDGRQQTWNGTHWMEKVTGDSRKRAKDDDMIVVYDTARLAAIPPLVEPLNLKPSRYTYGSTLAMRVTRKFAELFAGWLKTVPPDIEVRLDGELASLAKADVAGRVKLDVTESDIDWFDLRVVLDVADTTLTQAEIKLLLNAKGGYVRLAGKGWRRLQYDLTDDENERLARLGLSPRELSAEPQRLHALQLADEAAKKFLPEQQVEQIHRRVGELKARVAPPLPAGITAELRPYQLEGFHFLAYLSANHFGGILADDMGLGKTLQTLTWLVWLRAQAAEANADRATQSDAPAGSAGAIAPALVVCPKSVMDNWQAEAARFAPGLRVKIWSSSELENFDEHLKDADAHVLNYSQIRALSEELVTVRWLTVILDEGQYIKNPNSQTAKVARALRAEHRLILSGTPIENRLSDLWSLMSFAMPGVLGNLAGFTRIYDAKGDPFARRRLASRVRPFVLRRTKAQVAKDLPDRIEEDLFCEIEGEQKTLYRAELKRAQQLLLGVQTQKELAKHQFHFLTSLLRLRQICCDPRLAKADCKTPGAKLEALLDQLEPLMEEGEKVLVFSQFVEMLDLLREAIAERQWPIFYLAGDTENRGELVKKFQSAEGSAVFLISLKAGGFGLNLTAASYVVLFDPWWNPAVESQAIDRTHRIGQTSKVIAYRLLIKNSIEEKIRALQKKKKALADDVLGEEKFAQSLTLEDLNFLFAD
jgi:hypothetical protein